MHHAHWISLLLRRAQHIYLTLATNFIQKKKKKTLATNNNNNKKIKIQPYTHDRDGMKLQGFVNVNEKLNKNEDIFIYIQLTLVEIIMISPASH
jgi:hypothetical protein